MIFTMLINVECSQHCVVRVVVVGGALGEREFKEWSSGRHI